METESNCIQDGTDGCQDSQNISALKGFKEVKFYNRRQEEIILTNAELLKGVVGLEMMTVRPLMKILVPRRSPLVNFHMSKGNPTQIKSPTKRNWEITMIPWTVMQ